MRRDLNRLVITACELDPRKTYRVQVLGTNIFPSLDSVTSATLLAPPQ